MEGIVMLNGKLVITIEFTDAENDTLDDVIDSLYSLIGINNIERLLDGADSGIADSLSVVEIEGVKISVDDSLDADDDETPDKPDADSDDEAPF
jgi:hypothetical protein